MFEALDASGDVYGTVPYEAVQMVLWALPVEPRTGEEFFFGHKAIERELLVIENLDVTANQLGLDVEGVLAKARSYIDRFGQYKAPFGVAVEVAKHCCERFTQDVLRYVQAEEDALKDAVISGYYAFLSSGSRRRSYARRDFATFTAGLGDLLTPG